MSTIQQLVDQLGPGWSIVDGRPQEELTVKTLQDPLGVKPAQNINVGSGRYFIVVKDKDGAQRALFLSPQPIKGGLVVKQTGVNDTIPDPDKDPSGKLGTTKPNPNIYNGSLESIDWGSGGPLGDVPNKPNQPSPTSKLDRIDAQGNVIPATDTTTKPAKLRDPATGTVVDLPTEPNGVVTPVGNNIYVVKPDGSATPVVGKDGNPLTKQSESQALNVPGIGVVAFDPQHPENSSVVLPAQNAAVGQMVTRNGTTFIAVSDGKGGVTFTETNLPEDEGTYSVAFGANDPNSPTVTLMSTTGKTKVIDKPGYTKPPVSGAGQGLTADTEAPFQVTIGADGKPVYTENKNRLSISQAQMDLAKQLGIQVANGSMSQKEATDLITNQIAAMAAQAQQKNAQANMLTAQTGQQQLGLTAANDTLSQVNQAAQTGAGMLNQRVQAGTSALNQVVGQLGSGNLAAGGLPSGWGQRMAAGIGDFTAALGGGQATYDAAAQMVQQANPAISQNPTAASQAYQALRGYMDLYKAQTGQDWQPGQGTGSARPGAASSTFTAPVTSSGPTTQGIDTQLQAQQQAAAQAQAAQGVQGLGSTAALNQQGLLDTPQGRAMAAGQTPVATTPTGAPVQQVPGMINTAYQQGVVSPVGRPATGPVVGSPMIPTRPWTPIPFYAPVTA